MEACLAADELSVFAEGAAAVGDDGIEVVQGFEMAVDDGRVDVDPQGLGGLQFRRLGRQEDKADALGHIERRGMQPAPSSTSTMMGSGPAPTSLASSAKVCSKSALSTRAERYQKLSPVVGEMKAVT